MKLKDIASLPKYTLYCDADGVLVDFNKFAEEHIGIRPDDMELDKKRKKEFWSKVNRWVSDGNKFFEMMDPMPDMRELWDYIEKFDPIILTATGTIKNAAPEKLNWIRQHLGNHYADTAITVDKSANKAVYACTNCILIDDRTKSIDPWIEAGGIGILHISAQDTIAELKKLGL